VRSSSGVALTPGRWRKSSPHCATVVHTCAGLVECVCVRVCVFGGMGGQQCC
jgi:hypothetical protein